MLVQQGACPPITPRRGEMEITKGALEGISRPASGERFRAGSRVSRASVPEGGRADSSPTSLEVLSCDVAEDHRLVLEDPCASGDMPHESQNSFDIKELVGKNEDPQLQKAINKMKSLDKTLAIKISYEKEVRKQGRELHQKLWQELLESKTDGALERPDEAENTRLFLALTPNSLPESVTNEEVGGTIFSTQIPDKEYLKHINKECDTDNPSTKGSSEMVQERREDPAHSRASKGSVAKDRQKRNFVKKNIELASGGGHVPMTLEDRQRLSELLKDIQEDDEDTNRSAHQQATTSSCSVLIQAGEGYSPEPLQLDQLVQIDARLHTLLPVEDFLSVRSPYPDHISPQVGECVEETLPGERVLQDLKERRRQETRLREIQQQLETMRPSPSAETPKLSEEQMRSLLMDCERALSRTPSCRSIDLDSNSSWVSSSALSELLKDVQITSPTPPQEMPVHNE